MNENDAHCSPTASGEVARQNSSSISRRAFLGATAGAVSAASLGGFGLVPFGANAAEAPQTGEKPKDIRVGMLTAPVSDWPLDRVLDLAKGCHIVALEVAAGPGSRQLDPMTLNQADADAIKQKLADRGLEISSLSNYMDSTAPGKTGEVQTIAKKMIDAAALLNVPTICMGIGFPVGGRSKLATLKNVVPGIFRPIVDHAKDKGINVAIENWFATCLQGLDTFDCLMETIPDENFGFNYDPSHLVHQELDYMIPVAKFSKRIFHTHAKDCLVDVQRRNYVGILGDGWWRYVIPGYGDIKWGEYISHLRQVGYRGVLSIEHEDSTFNPEEGFRHGADYLNRYC